MTPISSEAIETDAVATATIDTQMKAAAESPLIATTMAVPVPAALPRPISSAPVHPKSSLPVLGRATQDHGITWTTAIFLAIFHVGAIAAFSFLAGARWPSSPSRTFWQLMSASACAITAC